MGDFENGIEIDGLDDIEIENTSVEEIDSENINLIFLGIDQSGSMDAFRNDMMHSLKEFKDALINSKEAEEILVARADFEDTITVGGYKKISEFDTAFRAGGCTAMYDAVTEGTGKLKDYRQYLKDQGVRVKAVFAIFSDGLDNSSKSSFSEAKKAVNFLNDEEITTAFISFGGEAVKEAKDLGFRNILDVTSSASELRKAFDCLSKSVIESSKSVVADGDDFFQI
ncbi:MAG: hypothetical protein K2M91_10080 [Lachnospiraceae bacterium]|nr:hypothetical protein [Lachnospiraceae bacterium]